MDVRGSVVYCDGVELRTEIVVISKTDQELLQVMIEIPNISLIPYNLVPFHLI